jgi:hypothetical protein
LPAQETAVTTRTFATLAIAALLPLACTQPTATPAAAASDTSAADTAADLATGATSDAATADAADTADTAATDTAAAATPTEFVAELADFDCIKNGTKVGHFYVANKLGKQQEAVKVAQASQKGGVYPLGTIIRLFPLEAMVKRGKGFEATGGWELFKLKTKDGQLAIDQRGGAEVKNVSGPCIGCHKPAKDYDFVCGKDHGCADLGVTDEVVTLLQDGDGQCAK